MKKLIFIISALLAATVLCSCSGNADNGEGTTAAEVTTDAATETTPETAEGEDVFEDDDVTVVCTGAELKGENLYLVRFHSVKSGERKLNCWVTDISVDGVKAEKDVNYLIAGLAEKSEAEGTIIVKSSDFPEGEIDLAAIEEITFTLTIKDENDSTYSVEKVITVKA